MDDTDYEWAKEHRWHFRQTPKGGYAYRIVSSQPRVDLYLHREILGLDPSDKREVDHKDRDKLNCQRSNLRIGTREMNRQNLPPIAGTSSHRGVRWNRRARRWEAFTTVGGFRYLGLHDSEEQAAETARAYRLAHFAYAID